MKKMFTASWAALKAADAQLYYRLSGRRHRSTLIRDNFSTLGLLMIAGLFEFVRGLKDGYEYRGRLQTAREFQADARKAFVNGDVFFTRQYHRQALDIRQSVLMDKQAIHAIDIPRWLGLHMWNIFARVFSDCTVGLTDKHLETGIANSMYHVAFAEMKKGDFDAAFPLLYASLGFVVQNKIPTAEKVRNMIRQGDVLQMTSSFEDSMCSYEWTIRNAKSTTPTQLRMPLLLARVHNNKFVTHFSRGEYTEAFQAITQCFNALMLVDPVDVIDLSDNPERCKEIISRIEKEKKIRLDDIVYVKDEIKRMCTETETTEMSLIRKGMLRLTSEWRKILEDNEKPTKEKVVRKMFEVMKDDAVDILDGLSPPGAIRMDHAERLKLMVRKYFTAHLNELEGMCFANHIEEIRKKRNKVMSLHDRVVPILTNIDEQWWQQDGKARYYATVLNAYTITGDLADNKLLKDAEAAYKSTTVSSTRARFLVETAYLMADSPEDVRNRLQLAMTAFAELDFKMTPRDRFYYALALQRYHKTGQGWFTRQSDDLLLEANFQIGMIFGEGVRWPRHPLWREDVYRRNAHRLGKQEVHYIERLIKPR